MYAGYWGFAVAELLNFKPFTVFWTDTNQNLKSPNNF
jgi:hypothetical protein